VCVTTCVLCVCLCVCFVFLLWVCANKIGQVTLVVDRLACVCTLMYRFRYYISVLYIQGFTSRRVVVNTKKSEREKEGERDRENER